MNENPEPEPPFKWDMVTWLFIVLAIVFVLLFAMLLLPHRFPLQE